MTIEKQTALCTEKLPQIFEKHGLFLNIIKSDDTDTLTAFIHAESLWPIDVVGEDMISLACTLANGHILKLAEAVYWEGATNAQESLKKAFDDVMTFVMELTRPEPKRRRPARRARRAC